MARYTQLTPPDVRRICHGYGLEADRLEPIDGGMANSSYVVAAGQQRYVLTVLDNHTFASAKSLSQLLCQLGERDLSPIPLTATVPGSGRSTGTGMGSSMVTSHRGRPVLLKPYVEGACWDTLSAGLLSRTGAAMAAVHSLPPDSLDVPHQGRRLTAEARRRCRDFTDREFASWLLDEWDRVTSFTEREVKATLVHGDLFPDNIVVTADDEVVFLDWETASLDDPLIDLGMAVVGLCRNEDGVFSPEMVRSLVAGYTGAAPSADVDSAALRDASVYAAIVIAYHRYVRHHITHPSPAKQDLYREVRPLVEAVRAHWPADLPTGADSRVSAVV
ncbi:phosphotransferase [Streptomyces sp. NPDC008150]|uniref:phosphotransferase n=1 Tax=Streptomyces sp. NPDC008150 TaxID=3364816 RepID=UPI0036E2938B